MRLLSPSLLLRASRGLATRACSRRDAQYLRRVSDGGFVLPAANPGVRLEPGFVDEAEEEALAAEARAAALSFGYDYDGDRRAHVLNPADGSIESTREVVNNTRVTGRPEKADQALPPWGYGDDFDESALPPAMGALAGRLRGSGLYNVGALRDLTLNLRRDSFFQLDPHLDPRLDGPHVFVLGLLSSVVTTFSPSDALLGANGLPPRRRGSLPSPGPARGVSETRPWRVPKGGTPPRSGCARGATSTSTQCASRAHCSTSQATREARGRTRWRDGLPWTVHEPSCRRRARLLAARDPARCRGRLGRRRRGVRLVGPDRLLGATLPQPHLHRAGLRRGVEDSLDHIPDHIVDSTRRLAVLGVGISYLDDLDRPRSSCA